MPWTTPNIIELGDQAKSIIQKIYSYPLDAQIFVVSQNDLEKAVINEQKTLDRTEQELQEIIFQLPFIVGKYFSSSHEIWIVEGKGEHLDIVIHEILHSIQKCYPNTEGIVNFITFLLTNTKSSISKKKLKEWKEIQKTNGKKAIFNRLVVPGDCEEF